MSATRFTSHYLKDKVIQQERNEVLVHYGCSMCGAIFLSEEVCDDHISNCINNTLNAEDPLGENSNNRTRKRKLDQSVSKKDSASLFDDSSSNDEPDNEYECKKAKESNVLYLKDEDYAVSENPVYEATSHMISENEMLITLPYAQINQATGGALDFSNEAAVGFEQHSDEINIFEQEHKASTSKETEEENSVNIIENYDTDDYPNIYRDSTVKILSVFTDKSSQQDLESKSKNIRICPNEANTTYWDNTAPTDNVENDNNKVLTILSTVDVNKIDTSNEKEITVMDLLKGGREKKIEIMEKKVDCDVVEGKGEQKVESRRQQVREKDTDSLPNLQEDKSDIQSKKNIQNDNDKKNILLAMTEKNNTLKTPSQDPKYSKKIQKDIVKNKIIKKLVYQESSPQENRRRRTKPRHRKAKETEKISVPNCEISVPNGVQRNQVLSYSYQEITAVKEEVKEDIPTEFAVFEFYDEEEERLKVKMREDQEKEKAIKKRTCRHCNELFDDPMDVLRHKRKFHKFEKIFLTKEKLQPYYDHKDKTECPVCFLFLGSKGYNSIYVQHLMTHSDEYNFACKICHMQFRRKDHWYNHESRHLIRPVINKKN